MATSSVSIGGSGSSTASAASFLGGSGSLPSSSSSVVHPSAVQTDIDVATPDQQNADVTSFTPYPQRKVEDALRYLDQVRMQFGKKHHIYKEFCDIMLDCKSHAIGIPGVIQRISQMFRGHPHLILGFNTFLPPGYKIEVNGDCGEATMGPVPTTLGATAAATNRCGSSDAHLMNGPALNEQAGVQPLELDRAVYYVNKIKKRFQNQPEVYKEFLERTYQKEHQDLKEVDKEAVERFRKVLIYYVPPGYRYTKIQIGAMTQEQLIEIDLEEFFEAVESVLVPALQHGGINVDKKATRRQKDAGPATVQLSNLDDDGHWEGWNLETYEVVFHEFIQANHVPVTYKYTPVGLGEQSAIMAEITLMTNGSKMPGVEICARAEGNTMQIASAKCALKLIHYLHSKELIEIKEEPSGSPLSTVAAETATSSTTVHQEMGQTPQDTMYRSREIPDASKQPGEVFGDGGDSSGSNDHKYY